MKSQGIFKFFIFFIYCYFILLCAYSLLRLLDFYYSGNFIFDIKIFYLLIPKAFGLFCCLIIAGKLMNLLGDSKK